jgi:Putative peptidoglycan binding domain
MGNLSANSQLSRNISQKGGFQLTPPTLNNNYRTASAISIGTIQQRLVLNLPTLSGSPMQPFHFCDNTESALKDFQSRFRLPATGQMGRTCWDYLFQNGIRIASATLRPDRSQAKRYVLLSPQVGASLLVPVTHANPLTLTGWGAAIPTPNPNGGIGLDDIELDAEWNDGMDGFDVTLAASRDFLKGYWKIGFAADQIIPTVNGNELPELALGVQVDFTEVKNFPKFVLSGASLELTSDTLQFGLSQSFELFHLKIETKQTIDLSLGTNLRELPKSLGFVLQVKLP